MSPMDATSPCVWRETLKEELRLIGGEVSASFVTDVKSPCVLREALQQKLQEQKTSSEKQVSKQHQKRSAYFGNRSQAYRTSKDTGHGKGKLGRVKTKGGEL